jgi:hypothetical protein
MYHVTLDTDILRQDPQRRSASLRRLQQLLNEGHVRLHIPDVVRREFLSAVAEDYRTNVKVAEDALRRVRSDFLPVVTPNLLTALRDLRSRVADKWHDDFDGWCQRQNVTIHATPPECVARIIDAYFEGAPPFRKPKSREDFPDALIYATVDNIARELGELHFIARDAKLREAVARIGIKCFPSIDAFLVATYQELSEHNDDRIFDLLFANVRLLEGETGRHLRAYLQGMPIDSEKLPHDDCEIVEIDELDVVVKLRAAEKLGGGYFRYPFEAKALARVQEESGNWTMYGYDDGDDDDDRDGSHAKIELSGVLEVHVQFSGSPDQYAENEQLRRAMYLAEHELLDIKILDVSEA